MPCENSARCGAGYWCPALAKIAVQVSSVSPSTCADECPASSVGAPACTGASPCGVGAAAAEQAHHELRAADEVRDDGEHDAAEAEPEAATAATAGAC